MAGPRGAPRTEAVFSCGQFHFRPRKTKSKQSHGTDGLNAKRKKSCATRAQQERHSGATGIDRLGAQTNWAGCFKTEPSRRQERQKGRLSPQPRSFLFLAACSVVAPSLLDSAAFRGLLGPPNSGLEHRLSPSFIFPGSSSEIGAFRTVRHTSCGSLISFTGEIPIGEPMRSALDSGLVTRLRRRSSDPSGAFSDFFLEAPSPTPRVISRHLVSLNIIDALSVQIPTWLSMGEPNYNIKRKKTCTQEKINK